MTDTLATIGAGMLLPWKDQILLVKQNHGKAKGHWTLPGGLIQTHENPEQGAQREVYEETGLRADPLHLLCVRYRIKERKYSNVYWVFIGALKDNPLEKEFVFSKDEIQAVKFWNIEELLNAADVRPMTKDFVSKYLIHKNEVPRKSYSFLEDRIYL